MRSRFDSLFVHFMFVCFCFFYMAALPCTLLYTRLGYRHRSVIVRKCVCAIEYKYDSNHNRQKTNLLNCVIDCSMYKYTFDALNVKCNLDRKRCMYTHVATVLQVKYAICIQYFSVHQILH